MTDLRDKISQIIADRWCSTTKNIDQVVMADAILALPEIADLQKKLDRQIGYKEDYLVAYGMALDDWAKAEARFIEQRNSLVSVTKKLAKTEAAISRVYQMGLDAAAGECKRIVDDGCMAPLTRTREEAFEAAAMYCGAEIRALTPPDDLVQQATKGADREL